MFINMTSLCNAQCRSVFLVNLYKIITFLYRLEMKCKKGMLMSSIMSGVNGVIFSHSLEEFHVHARIKGANGK